MDVPRMELVHEISQVLNKHSIENETNTPDFILAEYLVQCLDAYTVAIERCRSWHEDERQTFQRKR